MTQEIKIDDLFTRIDDELIILSEAKQKGEYKWFDFIAALRLLNDKLQSEVHNEYRKRKVSRLVNVFNDLFHTVVQTCCKRIISYDKERKISTEEWYIFGAESGEGTIEENVAPVWQAHYESLKLPEENLSKQCDVVKISYLLRDCLDKNDVLRNGRQTDFRDFFDMQLDLDKYRTSFEEYIIQLKAERNVSGELIKADHTSISKVAHFSVKKSYEKIQRILIALQQQGFVSTDTTVETFYYWMTGEGIPTRNKIEWIKKGKKRKSNISKSSLVYFLKIFASYDVDQTSDCRNRIEEIFGISLSASTITRSSNCEYKTEIDNIVNA
ncbi:hypothetical protein [uncultured Alistipes sp.]|uniref:hypothetical protein n=1 Tax=uncultured Alistipes sp. TaxID=538949 RepID=UPI00272B30A9|nr:hypothetical protein [uncultured Alistipes sp.]